MRGMVSSTIITNNLGVAFACFAGGYFMSVALRAITEVGGL